MFSHFVPLNCQRKLPLSTNIIHSRSTNMFCTILKQILKEKATVICMMHETEQNYRCLLVKAAPSLHQLCEHCHHQRKICIFWTCFGTQKEYVSSKWWKCLCQGKLPLGDKSWYSVHRWSTCNAWQHIWFGCYLEERYSTCHNDSLPSTPACNVIETLPAVLKGASSIAMKNQLYQSQGFKSFILAPLVKG